MSAISAVLPLKAYGRRYIDDPGRCHDLLTSLATFAPDDMFEDIFVVVPAREYGRGKDNRRRLYRELIEPAPPPYPSARKAGRRLV